VHSRLATGADRTEHEEDFMNHSARGWYRSGLARALTLVGALLVTAIGVTAAAAPRAQGSDEPGTVWLCHPGQPHDPCVMGLDATAVAANGATTLVAAKPAAASPFDCFYVYPTVSGEPSTGAKGAAWLEVTKSAGSRDKRPPVWPDADCGYHLNDTNLALGNLVADVAAAESTWTATHH
jgi:hypothetical protein